MRQQQHLVRNKVCHCFPQNKKKYGGGAICPTSYFYFTNENISSIANRSYTSFIAT